MFRSESYNAFGMLPFLQIDMTRKGSQVTDDHSILNEHRSWGTSVTESVESQCLSDIKVGCHCVLSSRNYFKVSYPAAISCTMSARYFMEDKCVTKVTALGLYLNQINVNYCYMISKTWYFIGA